MVTRAELEHAIRASVDVLRGVEGIEDAQVIVIGSQSILGTWTDDELPHRATTSEEVDIWPLDDDEAERLATLIDGVLGEFSPFHQTHRFYVQGVGARTAVLPPGWEKRLVAVQNDNTRGATGLCLDPIDLCVAKLSAGRPKDYEFVSALLDSQHVDPDLVLARAETLADEGAAGRVMRWVRGVVPTTYRRRSIDGVPGNSHPVAGPESGPLIR